MYCKFLICMIVEKDPLYAEAVWFSDCLNA